FRLPRYSGASAFPFPGSLCPPSRPGPGRAQGPWTRPPHRHAQYQLRVPHRLQPGAERAADRPAPADRGRAGHRLPVVRGGAHQASQHRHRAARLGRAGGPHALVRETVRRLMPGSGGGTIALESSTAYQTFLRLGRALPGWKFVDAGPVTDRLRVIKSPEEVALLRRAIAITLDAMAATFAQLAVGTTEAQ